LTLEEVGPYTAPDLSIRRDSSASSRNEFMKLPVDRSDRRGPVALLLLSLLGGLLYLPYFASGELDGEEGRRAIPAREMIESGNFVTPTVWERPYLAKPPLFFWLVAACASLAGGVDEAATRLPSVLATLLTALAVYWVGRRVAGPRAALFAAPLFLCTIVVFEKGGLGELEAVLTLSVFLGLALLWRGSAGDRVALLGSGLFIAAAMLTKGPPVLVFYLAALVGIVCSGKGLRVLRSQAAWLPLLIGFAPAAIWTVLLLRQPGLEGVLSTWSGELTRSAGFTWTSYLLDRGDYLLTVPLGFFPASFVCIAVVGTELWKRMRREPLFRFALPMMTIVFLFFLLVPGTRTRYAYPLAPWCCLLAGQILDRALATSPGSTARRRLRIPAFLIAALGLVPAAGALYLLYGPIEGFTRLGAPGYSIAAASLVASIATIRYLWRPAGRSLILACFVILCLLRVLHVVEVKPAVTQPRPFEEAARGLERFVAETETLQTNVWGQFNTLFYVRRRVVYLEDPRDASAGTTVLVDHETLQRLDGQPGFPAETLYETVLSKGREVALVRILPPP
jgi:4-amino-4-deoxy-L-arabinose transferase-like glycosyltransferase